MTTPAEPDIDEIVVERLVAGFAVPSNVDERIEAVRCLAARGCSTREIAERLRIDMRSVGRLRARIRQGAMA